MKINILLGMFFSLAVMSLSGCGGGGGAAPAVPTVVSGVASKGPFKAGSTVKVFGIDKVTGAKAAQVGTGIVLDDLGTYSVDIGTYTGPVIVEVFGTYKNEANLAQDGKVVEATPIRAAISNAVAGTNQVMVTALTELAVKEMGTTLVKSNIDLKNAEIAAIFKLADIITTKPADVTVAGATGDKNYGLALAAIAQRVKDTGLDLDFVLKGMADDISGNVMADASTAGFKNALFDFVASANNKTDTTTDNIATSAINIGTFKLAHLKISVQGLDAATKIGGVDFTFNLPAGLSLPKDAITNQVSSGLVVVAEVAATAGTTNISLATLNGQALRTVLANASGFGNGEFVNISCTVPASVTTSIADLKTAFTTAITSATFTATNLTGTPITITGSPLSAVVDVF